MGTCKKCGEGNIETYADNLCCCCIMGGFEEAVKENPEYYTQKDGETQ